MRAGFSEAEACPLSTSNHSAAPSVAQIIAAAIEATEQSIPVRPLLPGVKRPVERPRDQSVYTVDDPWDIEELFNELCQSHGDLNLGGMVGRAVESPVLFVGLDVYKQNGGAAHQWAQDVGISSRDPCLIIRTGRGGYAIGYFQPIDLDLTRVIEPKGLPVDLLVNGYQVWPPSDTSRDPKGGGRYTWVPGHSLSDISVADLMEPPHTLIEFWKVQMSSAAPSERVEGGRGKAWELLQAPIPEGGRNDRLTSLAGWLRAYHPSPIVEALLLAINDGRCQPPLSPDEVRGIARGMYRYPQRGVNGHPDAVVPGTWRRGQGTTT